MTELRRKPVGIWIIVALLLAVGIGGGGAAWLRARSARRAEALALAEQAKAAAARKELEALWDRVGEAVADHKGESVLPELWKAAETYPNDAHNRAVLAGVLADTLNTGAALDQYEASLKLDNQQAEVHLNAGNVAWELAQTEQTAGHAEEGHRLEAQALGHFEAAFKLEPANARCLLRRAGFYLSRPKGDRAAQDADLARAVVDLETLLNTKVRQDYERYGYEAWALLSDVLDRQNNPVAIEKIQKAYQEMPIGERTGPKGAIYLRKMAKLQARFNYFADARATLSKLSEQDQLAPDVVEQKAQLHMMMDPPERRALEAAREYGRAFEISGIPSGDQAVGMPDWRLASGAVRWYLQAADKSNAARYLTELRSLKPDAPEIKGYVERLKN